MHSFTLFLSVLDTHPAPLQRRSPSHQHHTRRPGRHYSPPARLDHAIGGTVVVAVATAPLAP
jgi:hypothetical protein